jgi:hypothetical protein
VRVTNADNVLFAHESRPVDGENRLRVETNSRKICPLLQPQYLQDNPKYKEHAQPTNKPIKINTPTNHNPSQNYPRYFFEIRTRRFFGGQQIWQISFFSTQITQILKICADKEEYTRIKEEHVFIKKSRKAFARN